MLEPLKLNSGLELVERTVPSELPDSVCKKYCRISSASRFAPIEAFAVAVSSPQASIKTWLIVPASDVHCADSLENEANNSKPRIENRTNIEFIGDKFSASSENRVANRPLPIAHWF